MNSYILSGLNHRLIVFAILISAITTIYFVDNINLLVILSFLIILYLLFSDDFLLFLTIVTLLTLPNTFSANLRLFIQISSFIILTYIFLKKNGLNLSVYPKVPVNIILFFTSLICLMFLSSFYSNFTSKGLEQTFRLILFLYLIYLIYSSINSISVIKLYLKTLVFCSIIFLGILFYELYRNDFNLIALNENIIRGLTFEYIGKNYLGVFFSLVIIMILSSMKTLKNNLEKKINLFILALLILGLLITNSRAAIFCLFVSLFFMYFLIDRKILIISLSIIVTIIVIFLVSPFSDEIIFYLRFEDISTGREYLIESVVEVIKNNFLFGAGPAATKYEIYTNIPFILGTPQELFILKNYYAGDLGQAHNFYIFYFGDLGVFGFILAIIFPVLFFKMAYRIINKLKRTKNEDYYILIGITSCGVFMFVRGFFEAQNIITYGGISADLPFWLLISIMMYYYQQFVHLRKA